MDLGSSICTVRAPQMPALPDRCGVFGQGRCRTLSGQGAQGTSPRAPRQHLLGRTCQSGAALPASRQGTARRNDGASHRAVDRKRSRASPKRPLPQTGNPSARSATSSRISRWRRQSIVPKSRRLHSTACGGRSIESRKPECPRSCKGGPMLSETSNMSEKLRPGPDRQSLDRVDYVREDAPALAKLRESARPGCFCWTASTRSDRGFAIAVGIAQRGPGRCRTRPAWPDRGKRRASSP